jgi:hypothetical protein
LCEGAPLRFAGVDCGDAVEADRDAIGISGGPMLSGHFHAKQIGDDGEHGRGARRLALVGRSGTTVTRDSH